MKKVTMLLFVLAGFLLGASAHACDVGSHKAKSTTTTTPTTSTGTSTPSTPAK